MEKHRFGLLGESITHSLSPQIYALFGLPEYELYPVSWEQAAPFFASTQLKGFNVTIPYKKLAYDLCDVLSPEAERLGNVNTVVIKDKKLHGYNTDYFGFLYMMDKARVSFEGKRVLILGTGGVSMTAHIAAQDRGAAEVVRISRHASDEEQVDTYENIARYRDFDILINATPVGMSPEPLNIPVNLDHFNRLEAVVDLIYNPLRTRLVLDARARNIKAFGALLMLVAQAHQAAQLYLAREIPEDQICAVYTQLLAKVENIVFVGMPGTAKAAIGNNIAHKMNRPFVDIDHYIHMTTGLHPAEWIVSRGERAFRIAESTALTEIASMQGVVIAPGGGGILTTENRMLLKQNSRIYWLKRPIAKLDREDKPLYADLEALYEARRALYEAVSDYAILNEDSTGNIADRIIEEFSRVRDLECKEVDQL